MKLENDDEKELYKVCVDECECYVECMDDNDCKNGMMCNKEKYECVDDGGMERRGTEIAQVLMIIPMAVCTFGVFSSVYLAKEYGLQYFSEKCGESCPTNNIVIHNVDWTAEDPPNLYDCKSVCRMAPEYRMRITENCEAAIEGGRDSIVEFDWDKQGFYFDKCRYLCEDHTVYSDVQAFDIEDAKGRFTMIAQYMCAATKADDPEILLPDTPKDAVLCIPNRETIECVPKS